MLNDGVAFTLDDASLFGWVDSDSALATNYDFGARNAVGQFSAVGVRNTSDAMRLAINGAVTTGGAGIINAIGLSMIQRISATEFNVFKDGVMNGATVVQNSVAVPDFTLRILAVPDALGTGGASGTNRTVSMVGAGASLVGKELSLYDDWNKYLAALP
jgi:hypothetical protein